MDNKSLIIIVTYNSGDFIETCLKSVISQSYRNWDLIMVDNNSTDDTVNKVRDFRNRAAVLEGQGLRLIKLRKNTGFAGAVNYAALNIAGRGGKYAYRYLILLNPDIILFPDALENLINTFNAPAAEAERSGIGAAGGLILQYDRDIIQHSGGKIAGNYITCQKDAGKEYIQSAERGNKAVTESDYVTGAFFATLFPLFRDFRGFDRGYRPVYFEELDYCLSLRAAGWRVVSNTGAVCRHFEGASVKKFSSRFYRHYHKNRLRCAVINMGIPQLLRIFVPSEIRWLKSSATSDQRCPLAYAYFINSVFLLFNLILRIKKHFILNRIELK